MKIHKRYEKGKRVMTVLLCAALLLGKVPAAEPVTAKAASQGTVLASTLYVRSGPGTTYDKVTVDGQEVYLTKNTIVDISSEKDGWYYVTAVFHGETIKGYISGKYVSVEQAAAATGTPTKVPVASSGNTASDFSVPARIWVSELNIRQTASTSGALVDTLKSGASVTVIGQTYTGSDKWYRVTYQSGGKTVTGYAYAAYVTLNGQIPTATPVPTAAPTAAPSAGNTASEFSVPARVIASTVNIRSGAGTGNSVITTLTYGTQVTATGASKVGNDTWYRISFDLNGTKKVGYAYGPYISLTTALPTATPAPTAAPTAAPSAGDTASEFSVPAKVIASIVNIRSGAGTGNSVITTLTYGTQVTATGASKVGNDTWYRISFDLNGTKKVGYAYGPYISLTAALPTATPVPTATPKPTATPAPTATPVPEGILADYRIPATVAASSLNVREQAGTDKAIVAILMNTAKVTATGSCFVGGDRWYCIEFDLNGVKKTGYVFGQYLKLSEPEPSKTPTPTEGSVLTPTEAPAISVTGEFAYAAKVSATQLNLRKGPGTEHGVVRLLTKDAAVTVTGEEQNGTDKWYRVSADGEEGYVLSDYIKLDFAAEVNGVLTEQVRLRSGAARTAAYVKKSTGAVVVLAADTAVKLTGEQTGTVKWFAVTCTIDGETVRGYIEAEAVKLGKAEALTPTPSPTPSPTPTPSPSPTPNPNATPTPSPTPTATPTPQATPAAEAKENAAGEQVGWGKAAHPNASSMVLKQLPKNGVGSVKVEEGSSRAVTVTSDTYLKLYGLYVDESGAVYRHVGVTYREKEYYGYILEERITECEAPATPSPTPDIGTDIWGRDDNDQTGTPGVSSDFELEMTAQGFPESYKPMLRELHAMYPDWVFKAYHTGLLWEDAVAEENIPGKNLIPNSSGIEWKSLEEGAYNWKTDSFIVYDGSTWVTASKAALEYYMDPRNFLDDKSIFQFEVLTYEPSYQNQSGIENILKYTPLYQEYYVYEDEYGQLQSISYSETFLKAAEYSGVSPYHLATRVKQEVVTGTTTVSNSVTGTVSGFEGLYNFYNIGAYHSTQAGGAIANGLKYAKYGSSSNDTLNDASLIPWNDRYRAIVGGAYIIGDSYINRGQNTIYLQKFNMTSYYTYSHQYMANVAAPSSEGKKTAQAYTGATDSPIVFSIPVFMDMPEESCPVPTVAYNPNNYLSKLAVKALDGTVYQLTPSFDGASVASYSLIVDSDTEVISIEATAVSRKAAVSGVGYHPLEIGRNELTVCVIAEDGSTREYQLYVVRE